MIYSSLLLNGSWEMGYNEEKYLSKEVPNEEMALIKDCVPGYWEDMTDKFALAPFYRELKINPQYGIQKYPMAGPVPDLALPNILGTFIYKRSFVCSGITDNALIHFTGVQMALSLWINDVYIGSHEGYSAPFDLKIPKNVLKDGENTITLAVSNHRLEGALGAPVVGISSRAACECSGGISGDIELRVYNCALRDVKIAVSDDCENVDVKIISTEPCACTWQVLDEDKAIKQGTATQDFSFDTSNLERWCPENPKLYTLKVICDGCESSYDFGVRKLKPNGVHLDLNGYPYFLRGICEHCYYPETVQAPHDIVFYRNVIRKIKSLGFNFIRFHTTVPVEEYLQAADELGILVEIESPNNTTLEEWKQIVDFARRHTSVVMYSCGNELALDDPLISHLRDCAAVVHENTDSLFSPMSAMRGIEYGNVGEWGEDDPAHPTVDEPFRHHPHRLGLVGEFSDLYNSYAIGQLSYFSNNADVEKVNSWSKVYNKPRVTHEICIDGTYSDLSLKDRYAGTRIGETQMFSSIEEDLKRKGLLHKAPIYFRNSCQWQRRMRKHCFEAVRLCENMAGYDFLGPIDTHWHTFGYDVGMMNEFYELKPGETQRNVLMYNSESVLLTDLDKNFNYESGQTLSCSVFLSYYGREILKSANLNIKLFMDNNVIERKNIEVTGILNGKVSKLYDLDIKLPEVNSCKEVKLYITLDGEKLFAENEWELYIYPKNDYKVSSDLIISDNLSAKELEKALEDGKDVLILGTKPFSSTDKTTNRICLAGRPKGDLATIINDHPIMNDMVHEGFCGWQFESLLEDGNSICFECDDIPFNPIVEIVSTHKYIIKKAAMFEFKALNGRLLVCSFNFSGNNAAANWLKAQIINYAQSDAFNPKDSLDKTQLQKLINTSSASLAANENFAFNANDITAKRKKK